MTEEQTNAQEAATPEPAAPAPRSTGAVWGLIAGAFVLMLVLCLGTTLGISALMGPDQAAVNSEVEAESPDAANDGATATVDANAVAATVNGQNIMEQDITDYIAGFRQDSGLETDEAWGEWLAAYGYTPETARQDILDSFVYEQLYNLAAQEFNIEVTQDDIDSALAELKSMYESDEEYEEDLAAYGMTEESYIQDSLIPMLLEQKIMEVALGDQITEDQDGTLFMAWLEDYKQQKGVTENPMPQGLPYDIDMTPYQSAAEDGFSLGDGSDYTIEGADAGTDDMVYLDEDGNVIDLDELELEEDGDAE